METLKNTLLFLVIVRLIERMDIGRQHKYSCTCTTVTSWKRSNWFFGIFEVSTCWYNYKRLEINWFFLETTTIYPMSVTLWLTDWFMLCVLFWLNEPKHTECCTSIQNLNYFSVTMSQVSKGWTYLESGFRAGTS